MNQRGYTLIEILLAIAAIGWFSFCAWLLWLAARALMKYIGS